MIQNAERAKFLLWYREQVLTCLLVATRSYYGWADAPMWNLPDFKFTKHPEFLPYMKYFGELSKSLSEELSTLGY